MQFRRQTNTQSNGRDRLHRRWVDAIIHTQWFYFMVSNTLPGVTYHFTILNFMKVGRVNEWSE